MKNNKIIWLVDDDLDEAKLYKRFFERGALLTIKIVNPKDYPSREDFRKLATDPRTGAFLVDQRLVQSGVDYTGTDLVRYLRQSKPDLSIYMLTGYPKDVKATGDVEEVIDKRKITKTIQDNIKRILRSVQRYDDALSERQKRLDALIHRKLSGKIIREEEAELEKLRQDIERPHGLDLIRSMETRKKVEIDEMQLLERISERLSRIESGAKGAKDKRIAASKASRKSTRR